MDRPSSNASNGSRAMESSVVTSKVDSSVPWKDGDQTQLMRQSWNQMYNSAPSDLRSGNETPKKTKKKNSGVVGFLTLKEPSTKALEQFAEAEREKAKQRGGVPMGVSSQKLPEHVPKVNSKWDGMPDSPKRISHEAKRPGSCKRDSAVSTAVTHARWDSNSHYTQERSEEHKGTQQYSSRPSSDGQNISLDSVLPWQAPHPHPELDPVPELSPFPSILTLGQRNADDPKRLNTAFPTARSTNITSSSATRDDLKYAQPAVVLGHEAKPESFEQEATTDSRPKFYQDKMENVKESISAPEVRRTPQVVNFSRPFSSG